VIRFDCPDEVRVLEEDRQAPVSFVIAQEGFASGVCRSSTIDGKE